MMRKTAALVALVLLAATAAPASAEWVMAGRDSDRAEDMLSTEAADRADLFLRAVDGDRDRHVSETDVRANPAAVAEAFPGLTADEFVSFLQVADRDQDGVLSRSELVDGLAAGLAKGQHTELLEVDAVRRRAGLFKGLKKFGKKILGNVKNKVKAGIRRATGRVDRAQDACVTCQYIVERLETNVRQSGVIPTMPTGDVPMFAAHSNNNPFAPYLPTAPGPSAPGARPQVPQGEGTVQNGQQQQQQQQQGNGEQQQQGNGEQQQQQQEGTNFLEVSDPYDAAAGGIIAATRESTRVQRQMERQKYNEIYRVVDITLDDVCEQSMPSAFYGFCKQIYQTQSDVVEGLRYQYRPADICFRTGMCGKDSYITKGIHSRYQ